jgi:hypothetical protein
VLSFHSTILVTVDGRLISLTRRSAGIHRALADQKMLPFPDILCIIERKLRPLVNSSPIKSGKGHIGTSAIPADRGAIPWECIGKLRVGNLGKEA